jgi:hypothetical protein
MPEATIVRMVADKFDFLEENLKVYSQVSCFIRTERAVGAGSEGSGEWSNHFGFYKNSDTKIVSVLHLH